MRKSSVLIHIFTFVCMVGSVWCEAPPTVLLPETGPLGWRRVHGDVYGKDFFDRVLKISRIIDLHADVQFLLVGGREGLEAFSISRSNEEDRGVVCIAAETRKDGKIKTVRREIPASLYLKIRKLWIDQLKKVRYPATPYGEVSDALTYHLYSFSDGNDYSGYFSSGDYRKDSIELWTIAEIQFLVRQSADSELSEDDANSHLEKELERVISSGGSSSERKSVSEGR
jgi:hypothetical protein